MSPSKMGQSGLSPIWSNIGLFREKIFLTGFVLFEIFGGLVADFLQVFNIFGCVEQC